MKYETVKTKDDLPDFPGVEFDFEVVDGNTISLTIKSVESGDILKITKGGVYTDSIKVLREKPIEYVEKWQVSVVTTDGLSVNKLFDNQYEADNFSYEISNKYNTESSLVSKIQVVKEDNSI